MRKIHLHYISGFHGYYSKKKTLFSLEFKNYRNVMQNDTIRQTKILNCEGPALRQPIGTYKAFIGPHITGLHKFLPGYEDQYVPTGLETNSHTQFKVPQPAAYQQ